MRLLHRICICIAVSGSAAVGAEQAVGKYAQSVQDEREMARAVRDGFATFVADSSRQEAFIKEDVRQARKDVEIEAALHEQAAAAFEREDVVEGRRLREEAGKALKARVAWRERIGDFRLKQALAAPSEQTYADEMRWPKQNTRPEFDAWIEARKTLSEAWGRVAEASGPGVHADSLTDLKEAAYAADVECDIAELRYTWAKQREDIWSDKKVASADLEAKLAALQAVQERRVALRRAAAGRDREDRRIEREIRLAVDEYRKAYEEARIAREKTVGKK